MKFILQILFLFICIQLTYSKELKQNNDNNNKMKEGVVGMIIIICVIGIVLLLLLIVGIILWIRKCRNKQKHIFIRLDSNYRYSFE